MPTVRGGGRDDSPESRSRDRVSILLTHGRIYYGSPYIRTPEGLRLSSWSVRRRAVSLIAGAKLNTGCYRNERVITDDGASVRRSEKQLL